MDNTPTLADLLNAPIISTRTKNSKNNSHRPLNPRMVQEEENKERYHPERRQIKNFTPPKEPPTPTSESTETNAPPNTKPKPKAKPKNPKLEEPFNLPEEIDNPPLIFGLATVDIKRRRKNLEIIKNSRAVERFFDEENQKSRIVQFFAKRIQFSEEKIKKSKHWWTKGIWSGSKMITNGLMGTAFVIRHPIVFLQKIAKEPFQRRNMIFSIRVNNQVNKLLGVKSGELVDVSDGFIIHLLKEAKKKRNKNLGSKLVNTLVDILPNIFALQTSEQMIALRWLKNQEKQPSLDQSILDLRKNGLKKGSDLAQRFAITTENFLNFPDEKINKIILSRNEERERISGPEKEIKGFFEKKLKKTQLFSSLTENEKQEISNHVREILKENGVIDENEIQTMEVTNNALYILEELFKQRDFYLRNWNKLKLSFFKGISNGEAFGQDEKITFAQKIVLKEREGGSSIQGRKNWLSKSILWVENNTILRITGTAKMALYVGGYLTAWGMGMVGGGGRILGSSEAKKVVSAIIPLGLGAVWSGIYGGIMSAGKTKELLKQTSYDIALQRDIHSDPLHQKFFQAHVSAIPAKELTNRLNNSFLQDENNWHSPTKEFSNKEELEGVITQMAHIKSRLDMSMLSGDKKLNRLTQNWISYREGHDQEELTKLKTSYFQGLMRLTVLASEKPNLFKDIPFYKDPESLPDTIANFSAIINQGLYLGLPLKKMNNISKKEEKKRVKFMLKFNKNLPSFDSIDLNNVLDIIRNQDTEIGGKKISEWLTETESFLEKKKAFKKLRWHQFWSGFSQGVISSVMLSETIKGLNTGIKEGRNIIHGQTTDHTLQPTENISQEGEQSVPLNTNEIFTKPGESNPTGVFIWKDSKVQLAHLYFKSNSGYHIQVDNDGNYDVVDRAGRIKINNLFIPDKNLSHASGYQASASQTMKLNPLFRNNFKIENSQRQILVPQNTVLHTPSEVVSYLKEKGISTHIGHRYWADNGTPDVPNATELSATTYIDTQGILHFYHAGGTATSSYRTGLVVNITQEIKNNKGVLYFTFGTKGSNEGVMVPIHYTGKVGEFTLDLNNIAYEDKASRFLASLVDKNVLQSLKNSKPDKWLTEQDLAKLFGGNVKHWEFGRMVGNNTFEAWATETPRDFNPSTTIHEQVQKTINQVLITPTTETLSPNLETLPSSPVVEPAPSPIIENYTPLTILPGGWNSPELPNLRPETNTHHNNLPFPIKPIDADNFEINEKPHRKPRKDEVKNFINNLPDIRGDDNSKKEITDKINQFIEKKYLSTRQNKFVSNNKGIIGSIYKKAISLLRKNNQPLFQKIKLGKTLDDKDWKEYKEAISRQALEYGFTKKQANFISEIENIRYYMYQHYLAQQLFRLATRIGTPPVS